jgi:hypothetical protein
MTPVTAASYALPAPAGAGTRQDSRPLVLLPGANGAPGPLTTWRRAGQTNPEDSL